MSDRRLQALSLLVGNTPLLKIHYEYGGRERSIYAKSENLNMTGSVKDRMALYILGLALEREMLPPDATIVEATSGNTGISFAGIGRALGHACRIYMPDWMSCERIGLIRSFGAETILVSAADGGFLGSIQRAEEYAEAVPNTFLPRQFSNEDNIAAHERTTGPEILHQLKTQGRQPDAFVAGVGTGGTIMGVGRYLRKHVPAVLIHPLEPANSPTLRTGTKVGSHRIQGISDEFIPPIVDLDILDSVLDAADGDSILLAQELAASLGLGVGISSGANFLGAVQLEDRLGPGSTVVTIFPDSNKKYLSTDLLKPEPVLDEYLAPQISLKRFEVIDRRPCEATQTALDIERPSSTRSL
jgi:cysteine synthase A